MFCRKCGTEYVIGITWCKDCGIRLSDNRLKMEECDFIDLVTVLKPDYVDMVARILESEKISFYSTSDSINIVYPFIDGVRFFVRKNQINKARELVNEIELEAGLLQVHV